MKRNIKRGIMRVRCLKLLLGIFIAIISISLFTAAAVVSTAGEYEDMILVPEGPFVMGDDMGGADAKPAHTVYLKAFFIDRYEVTNADFAKFLNEKGNRMEGGANWIYIGREGCKIEKVGRGFKPVLGCENHPVVMVTYYGAKAYADWMKKRLPTEAEWEKAARGGLSSMKYPRGDDINTINANYGRRKMGTAPVGNYPPNGFGLYDVAGNAAEMVNDFYAANYYRNSPEMNPGGPEVGENHVIRGGDYLSHSEGLSVYKRCEGPSPYVALPNVGFRLVKDLK
ncbi:MAG: formylglycine-generating enzyme family protein [Deltaproteobacteria bacterium]|uniref:Formylglycine-generating enzyme family protein n=1 Tax=Candidatus Zymogenus saltonus TaxID=2844893 RepID=A0A9D8KFL3_9DELT|nr:formylglycine-generating enzyme family protein [Candidatus Zymogenus saltonus]